MGGANGMTIVRALLMAVGMTFLVGKGVISQQDLGPTVDAIMNAAGAVGVAGALLLSVWRNYQAKHAIIVAAATQTPVQLPALAKPTVDNAVATPTGPADVLKAKAAATGV